MPATEDRATLRSDLSANWLPRGRHHTVSAPFCLDGDGRDTGGELLRNKAINLGVQGAEPLEGGPSEDSVKGYFPVRIKS